MKVLSVYFHDLEETPVYMGRIGYHINKAYFEFDKKFLALGINPSPFVLKQQAQLQEAPLAPFNGLHGIFNDSLPDGWGLYLMDKLFKQNGIDLSTITPVDRLAYMGDRAMGALSYRPDEGERFLLEASERLSIDRLAEESAQLYAGKANEVLDELAVNGTPSGGARPKVLLGLRGSDAISGVGSLPSGFEYWLAKFPTGSNAEKKSEGSIEYIYSTMARQAGIEFPETKLVQGRENNLYFLTNRFDRGINNKRHHIHSLAGLINADFRVPDCDYKTLIKVCSNLTKLHEETSEIFKRMLFNIMSGNRDDHSKNFSFMMDSKGCWRNTPAYDVTYNIGINGEHSMDISGHGKNITMEHIRPLSKIASLSDKVVNIMIDEIAESLRTWRIEAKNYNIPQGQIAEISEYIEKQTKLLTPAFF